MNHQGYCVLMVEYIYIFAQERDDAGTAGVLMDAGNNYNSGMFKFMPGFYCDWMLSWLSRVTTHFWQVILVTAVPG